VLGIGIVTMIQLVLTVGIAGTVATRTGVLDTSQLQLGPTIGWLVLFFLIGFATFSIMLAALASTVSRQEEVSSVVMPGLMLAMIPYVIGIAVLLPNPQSTLGTVLSMMPFFAPFLMPLRVALGVAPGWELAIGLVVSLVLLPVLSWLAGRIYSTAVLRTGARVKLADALRAAK
jgi:ABC-2 type transport system permease protein